MTYETPQAELLRLTKRQSQMRYDKIFGGLSAEEQRISDEIQVRICDLRRRMMGGAEEMQPI